MTDLGAVLKAAFEVLKADEKKVVGPLLIAALQSLAQTPTALNFAAQAVELAAAFGAAQGGIQADVLQSLLTQAKAALADAAVAVAVKTA